MMRSTASKLVSNVPYYVVLISLVAALPGVSGSEEAGAANAQVSGGAELDFNSRYLWRGIPLSEGAVLQPDGWVSWRGFSFEAWANQVLGDREKRGEFDEATFIAGWEARWGPLRLTPSFTWYAMPTQAEEPDTGETGFTAAIPLREFSFSTEHQFDVVEYKGSYYGAAGIEWKKELLSGWELSVPLTVAWANARFNDVNIGVPKAALNNVSATLAVAWRPKPWAYLRPHLDINRLLDSALREAIGRTLFVEGGVALGVEF